MDISNECHVVRILRDYGDSILDGTFLSRIQEDTGIRADQPLDVEQILAQGIHQQNSLSQLPNTHISWPCQLCIRIILLVAHSPSLPHIINQLKCHNLPPSDSATDHFKEGLYANLEDPEQIPVEVAPLRIRLHPEPSALQHVLRENIHQPLTTLSSSETAQFGSSQLESPERNTEFEELSDDELQMETTSGSAVGFPPTQQVVLLMSRDILKTPPTLGQRASNISLPEIHTDSSKSENEEERNTPPSWTNSLERDKKLYAQDGRDSLRRRAFGSPYSTLHVPMKEMFPGTRTEEWARTNSEGKFSNIYSPSQNSPTRLSRQTVAKPSYGSALTPTPSRVGPGIIVRTAKMPNTLAVSAKRGILPRACKGTSSSEAGNPTTVAGCDAIVGPSPTLPNCEVAPQLKVRTLNLAGTGFGAPAKRPVRPYDHQKIPSRKSLPGEINDIKAQISLSVNKSYPIIFFFLPSANATQYLDFNPYSLRAKKAAILTKRKKDTLITQGVSISAEIQSSIDDSQVNEVFASDGFTLNDLIPRPGRPANVRDAMSKVQNRKKDVLNMLNWIDYSMARVYESLGEVRKPEYDLDVMNVYLCCWAWFRLLGPVLNGRRQRSWIVLCLRSKVGITKLKSYLNPNHRPISFHILLTQLQTLEPPVAEGGDFTPGCETALDYIKRLLRGSRALNGKIITDDIVTNALMWVPPEYHTGGSPITGLQAPLTRRPQNVIPDEGVVLSSDFDDESQYKARHIEAEGDSGFGGITDRSGSDSMMEDSDHRHSLAYEVQNLVTQLENCRRMITTDANVTRPFKFFCGPESIRQLAADFPLEPAIFDIIVALAKPAGLEYSTVYLGTFIYPEIEKARFGRSKLWVNHIPRVGVWILPILIDGHWRAMRVSWGEREKTGKRTEMDKRGKELELYDPQYYQAGSEASFRGKRITARIKDWAEHLGDNSECITWKFKRALGPVQDRDDDVHCGIYTLQTVCSWYGGRHPISQLADPIKLRREFIRHLQASVDGKKVRTVPTLRYTTSHNGHNVSGQLQDVRGPQACFNQG